MRLVTPTQSGLNLNIQLYEKFMSEQTTLSEYLRRNAIEKKASPFLQRKDYRLWESTASQRRKTDRSHLRFQ